jgi:hypothetical protein
LLRTGGDPSQLAARGTQLAALPRHPVGWVPEQTHLMLGSREGTVEGFSKAAAWLPAAGLVGGPFEHVTTWGPHDFLGNLPMPDGVSGGLAEAGEDYPSRGLAHSPAGSWLLLINTSR